MTKRIIIIGAGPTGIGAAYRLHELGYTDWAVYERLPYVGGHAASHRDGQGFWWDEGGHVIFSHYPYFDRFLEQLLCGEYLEHERQSWIRILESWVPYPFQNNIRHLPPNALLECVMGLVEAQREGAAPQAANFADWVMAHFGAGIARYFMFPYNFKVWAFPLQEMDKQWIAERVSTVDLRRVLGNIIYGRDDVSWGPNNMFKFPLHGGTGEIYRRAAQRFPAHLHCGKTLVEVNLDRRQLSFADGSGDHFNALITTMPLDLFVGLLRPAQPELVEQAARLQHNGMFTVGIGLEKRIETSWCWLYFPEANCPFYRVTYFHNYSPNNVPGGDVARYSSLMCEVSFSSHKPVQRETIVDETIQGLINAGILQPNDRAHIVSRYVHESDYAYPIPTLERDLALAVLQPALMAQGIYSRGRFGAYKYEIGNMDHSVLQGVQAVDHILSGRAETVWNE